MFSREFNFNSLFDEILKDADFFSNRTNLLVGSSFKLKVLENNESYRVLAELVGVNKEDINVNIEGEHLTISAEKKDSKLDDNYKILYSEVFNGKLERKLRLKNMNAEKVEASFEQGVLTLLIKKNKVNKTGNIKIK